MWRHAHAAGSYASARDPRVLVGLGGSTRVARVTVFWPDGSAEEWADLAGDPGHAAVRARLGALLPTDPSPLVNTADLVQPHHTPLLRSLEDYPWRS